MKTVVSIFCMLMSGSLFAQNTIFAGKITDSKGKPIYGAHVYIGGGGGDIKADAISDFHGLFRTQDVPAGDYHIIVDVNGKTRGDSRIDIVDVRGEKRYYLLQLDEKGMSVTTTDKNLFIEAKLDSIRKIQRNVDIPTDGLKNPEGGRQQYRPAPTENKHK